MHKSDINFQSNPKPLREDNENLLEEEEGDEIEECSEED